MGKKIHLQVLEKSGDLIKLASMLPSQDRIVFVEIIQDMYEGKISSRTAAEQVKEMLIKSGIYKETPDLERERVSGDE